MNGGSRPAEGMVNFRDRQFSIQPNLANSYKVILNFFHLTSTVLTARDSSTTWTSPAPLLFSDFNYLSRFLIKHSRLGHVVRFRLWWRKVTDEPATGALEVSKLLLDAEIASVRTFNDWATLSPKAKVLRDESIPGIPGFRCSRSS